MDSRHSSAVTRATDTLTAPEGDPDAICPAFAEIAEHYGPFDLSLLPISTGSSLPFLRSMLSLSLDQYTLTSSLHCSPGDALEIHSGAKEPTVGRDPLGNILRCRRGEGHEGRFSPG